MIHEALSLITMSSEGDIANSPFIVPVAGCIMIFGIVAAGTWKQVREREIKSQERLAAIAAGVPLPVEPAPPAQAVENKFKKRDNIRLAGTLLVGGGAALVLFFFVLTVILRQREILAGAAAGLIPLGLGIAFLIDARTQTRHLQSQPPQ